MIAETPSLLDWKPRYPDVPGSKRTAPETSRAAADSVKPCVQRLRDGVLEQLKQRDLTADECAEAMGEQIWSIRPRLSELKAKNKITDSGVRRPSANGNSAVVWRLA